MIKAQQLQQLDERGVLARLNHSQDHRPLGRDAMRCESMSWPRGFGTTTPVCRNTETQRTAVAIPIWICAAAAWHDSPPLTAAITRARRSIDSVFSIHTALRPSIRGESHHARAGNPLSDSGLKGPILA